MIQRHNFTDHMIRYARAERQEDKDDIVAEMVQYVARLERALDRANAWSQYTND